MQIDLSALKTDVAALQALVPLVEAQHTALVLMKEQLDALTAKLAETGTDPVAVAELAALEASLHAATEQLAASVPTTAAGAPPPPLLPPIATPPVSTTPAPAPSGAPTGVEVAAKPD